MNGRSEDSERALLLSPESPYPLIGGGALRSASLLHALAARYKVDLISFAEEGSPDPAAALPAGLVARTTTIRLPRHRRDLLARVWRNGSRALRRVPPLTDRFCRPESLRQAAEAVAGRRYDLAVIEHFWCAPYLPALGARARRVVLDLHNIESALHAGVARTEGWPKGFLHRRFERAARLLEREQFPRFDLILTASDEDRRRAEALAPGARVAVYPNAIPLTDRPLVEEENVIAFSGNLAYPPNVTAIKYFLREIWPAVRELDPALRWRVIGKGEAAIRGLIGHDPRIEATGPVEDAVAELARARLVVVPVLAGSGTRVKIIEAWAAARAVIATPIGAEGLPARHNENILLAEGTERWVEAIGELLRASALRTRLGEAGRATFEQSCNWTAAWRALDSVLFENTPPSSRLAQAI